VATVYRDDDEAEQAWLKLKVLPKDRILRFGEKDNFWRWRERSMRAMLRDPYRSRAELGYSTEHPGKACDQKAIPSKCAVNIEGCSRFIELGNLVFIQYNRDAAAS